MALRSTSWNPQRHFVDGALVRPVGARVRRFDDGTAGREVFGLDDGTAGREVVGLDDGTAGIEIGRLDDSAAD